MSVEKSTYLGYGFVLDDEGTNAAAATLAAWMGPDTEEEWKRGNYYPTELLESYNLDAFLKDKGMAGEYTLLMFGSAYDNSPNFLAVVLKRTSVDVGDDYAPRALPYVAVKDDDITGVDRENLDWVAALLLPEGVSYIDYGWVVGTMWS